MASPGSSGFGRVRNSSRVWGSTNISGAPSSIHTPTCRLPRAQAANATRGPREIVPALETVRSTSTMPAGGTRFEACAAGPTRTV